MRHLYGDSERGEEVDDGGGVQRTQQTEQRMFLQLKSVYYSDVTEAVFLRKKVFTLLIYDKAFEACSFQIQICMHTGQKYATHLMRFEIDPCR